jgi:hypothetical protein
MGNNHKVVKISKKIIIPGDDYYMPNPNPGFNIVILINFGMEPVNNEQINQVIDTYHNSNTDQKKNFNFHTFSPLVPLMYSKEDSTKMIEAFSGGMDEDNDDHNINFGREPNSYCIPGPEQCLSIVMFKNITIEASLKLMFLYLWFTHRLQEEFGFSDEFSKEDCSKELCDLKNAKETELLTYAKQQLEAKCVDGKIPKVLWYYGMGGKHATILLLIMLLS